MEQELIEDPEPQPNAPHGENTEEEMDSVVEDVDGDDK